MDKGIKQNTLLYKNKTYKSRLIYSVYSVYKSTVICADYIYIYIHGSWRMLLSRTTYTSDQLTVTVWCEVDQVTLSRGLRKSLILR